MKSNRTNLPSDLGAQVLFEQDHTCCICRERGKSVQIHHIDEDPSNHEPENLAVLCFEHHEQTQVRGGFGRKLLANEVIRYRDDWLTRVVDRRRRADEIAALRMATGTQDQPTTRQEADARMIPGNQALVAYVESLPQALAQAYAQARPLWDSGITSNMMKGNHGVIDVIEQMWIHLATWFPQNHFGDIPANEFFSDFLSFRFMWHRALAEPNGPGTGGTIAGVTTGGAVLADVERAVEDTVCALLEGREGFDFSTWQREWRRASRE